MIYANNFCKLSDPIPMTKTFTRPRMIDYDMAKRIEQKRLEAGLNQSELARKVGVTPQAVQSWEKGVMPRGRKLNDIALALHTTPEYLLFGKNKHGSNTTEHVVCVLVPLINDKQALNTGMIRKADYNKNEFKDWVPCPVECSRHTFAFTVRGDSMANPFGRPSFFDGDVIYVDPAIDYKSGSLVVAKVVNDVYFRKFIVEGNKRYLIALNPAWPGGAIELSDKDDVLGAVIYQGIKT